MWVQVQVCQGLHTLILHLVLEYRGVWLHTVKNVYFQDFPGGAVVKNPPANAGDTGSNPDPGRSHMPWSN